MKYYVIAVFCLLTSLKTFGQQDSALSYHKRAFESYNHQDYAGCLFWSEKLFNTHLKNFRNNYNLYRASVSACQVNQPEKALAYFKEMSELFLDFYNYPMFAGDSSKLSCITSSLVWKNAMAYMKPKYDSMQKRVSDYNLAIRDTTRRLNRSPLSDSLAFAKLVKGMSFEKLYNELKNYNAFSKAPVTNHWTLYEVNVNDTLSVPYLVYIPTKYNSKTRTPLYIFLQGAVSNRQQFGVEEPLFQLDDIYLRQPAAQNAFIIYPLARKDINWLYHPAAFEAITKQISFVKSLYNIDDDKVYLTGHSDGGRGVFYFALNRPSEFASFLALNFFPQSLIANTPLRNLRNDKSFFSAVGTKDNIFSFGKVDSIYRYGQSIGDNWKNFAFDEGHGLPTDNPSLITFLYDTLRNKTRKPFTKKIEWETDNVANGRYQWIEITKLDTTLNSPTWAKNYNPGITNRDNTTPANFNKNKSGIIIASITGNEVSIQTSRVAEFSFYVYPELIDAKRPIKFNVNGKTFFKVIPQHNIEDLLNEFAKTKDRVMLPIEKITLGFGD